MSQKWSEFLEFVFVKAFYFILSSTGVRLLLCSAVNLGKGNMLCHTRRCQHTFLASQYHTFGWFYKAL